MSLILTLSSFRPALSWVCIGSNYLSVALTNNLMIQTLFSSLLVQTCYLVDFFCYDIFFRNQVKGVLYVSSIVYRTRLVFSLMLTLKLLTGSLSSLFLVNTVLELDI